jgi:hypothetical protein
MPTRAQVCTWIAAVGLLAPCMAAGHDRTEREIVELVVRDGPQARAIRAESEVRRREQAARLAYPNPSVTYSREGPGFADDGKVYDTDRIMFVRAYLTQLQRATEDGVPVRGYFYWSSMDNLEWTAGFGNRYGIVYVDFKSQKRKPKMSASFFRECSRRNAVA